MLLNAIMDENFRFLYINCFSQRLTTAHVLWIARNEHRSNFAIVRTASWFTTVCISIIWAIITLVWYRKQCPKHSVQRFNQFSSCLFRPSFVTSFSFLSLCLTTWLNAIAAQSRTFCFASTVRRIEWNQSESEYIKLHIFYSIRHRSNDSHFAPMFVWTYTIFDEFSFVYNSKC